MLPQKALGWLFIVYESLYRCFSANTLLWPDQVVLQKLIVREVKDAAHPALAWIAQVVRTVQSCSEANHQQVSD